MVFSPTCQWKKKNQSLFCWCSLIFINCYLFYGDRETLFYLSYNLSVWPFCLELVTIVLHLRKSHIVKKQIKLYLAEVNSETFFLLFIESWLLDTKLPFSPDYLIVKKNYLCSYENIIIETDQYFMRNIYQIKLFKVLNRVCDLIRW